QVTVLRVGKVVETGPTEQVLGAPQHEYTQALMAAVPPLDHKMQRFLVPESTLPSTVQASEDASEWLRHGAQTLGEGLDVTDITVRFFGTRTSL
ncbi:ABC transporter ATP-binding protein, partial [Falsihalocynthiibacter sp. S25ZX9]